MKRLESDLRGYTYREAFNRPHLRDIHWCFVLLTLLFVWPFQLNVELALLGYWVIDFGFIWLKWHSDNKPRNPNRHLPPYRNPSVAPSN